MNEVGRFLVTRDGSRAACDAELEGKQLLSRKKPGEYLNDLYKMAVCTTSNITASSPRDGVRAVGSACTLTPVRCSVRGPLCCLKAAADEAL